MRNGQRSALYLTLSRMVLGPLFVFVYTYPETLGISAYYFPYVLLAFLAYSELSDIFDGLIARKTNQVTDLGKLLDPMADSIFRMSVFFAFTGGIVKLPLILILFFFYRDSVIAMLRTLFALKGVALAARTSGKIKAVVQGVTALFIVGLLFAYTQGTLSLEKLQDWSFYATLIAVIYSVVSGIEYIIANRSYLKRAFRLS